MAGPLSSWRNSAEWRNTIQFCLLPFSEHLRVESLRMLRCGGSLYSSEPLCPDVCTKNVYSDSDSLSSVDSPRKDEWAGLDSNQRRLTPTGLQPVPFSLSGTDPFLNRCKICRILVILKPKSSRLSTGKRQ